jgi:hypothetical protein
LPQVRSINVTSTPRKSIGVQVIQEGGEVNFPSSNALVAEVVTTILVNRALLRPSGGVVNVVNIEAFDDGHHQVGVAVQKAVVWRMTPVGKFQAADPLWVALGISKKRVVVCI